MPEDRQTNPDHPRVVLLTSPGLFGAIIINTLAEHVGLDLVGVGLTNRVYKGKGLLATAKTFLRRTGWRYTHYSVAVANAAWIILRLTGRPRGLRGVKQNVRLLDDVNSDATIAWLKELAPDYMASFYFNQWIGAGVRAVPERGCVNIHPSLLPALRGPDPVFRALERGLTKTGLTIHIVDEGFDTGQILHQEERAVPAGVSVFGLFLHLVRDGAQVLSQWLAGWPGLERSETPVPAPVVPDDYTTFPTPSEVRAFLKSGHRLICTREFWRALRQVR